MAKNEDLFEGIKIMSPQEIESSISNDSVEGESSNNEGSNDSPDNFTIEPVTATEPNAPLTIEPTSNNETSNNSEVDANMYSALIKDLMSEGIFSNEEDEEKLKSLLADASASTLKELMTSQIGSAVEEKQNEWKSNFSGAKKKFLEVEDAFTDADRAVQVAQQLEFFENLNPEAISQDEKLQQNIYFDYLKSKNFSDNDAIEAVQDATTIGKISEKALKYAPVLKESLKATVDMAREQKEQAIQNENIKHKESFENILKSIEEKDHFVEGLNINKIGKEKLKNNITNTVYTDDKGKSYTSLMYKQMRNPSEFEMLINYYDSIGMFDLTKEGGFKPNISKLKNVAKTKAVSEMDKVIAANNERGVGRAMSNPGSNRTQGILDFLENASKNK